MHILAILFTVKVTVQAHQTQGGKLTKQSGLVMGTKGIGYEHKYVQQFKVLVKH